MNSVGPSPARVWGAKVSYALCAVFFAYATSVQFNDVDASLWVGLYGVALTISVVCLLERPKFLVADLPLVAASLSVVSLVWALYLGFKLDSSMSFADSEIAREVGGLVIVGVFAATVAWLRSRAREHKSA